MSSKGSLSFENNSLDVLRQFAALQIAVTHYLNLAFVRYGVSGRADTVLLWGKRVLGFFPGLIILFAISGFLMGNSLERTTDRKSFLKKRFLRIYPGLWVNILFNFMLILAVFPAAREHLGELCLWACLQGAGLAYTPGFLQEFGAGSVNGTLWTIMVELQFYLLLALFWNFLKRQKDGWWCGLFGMSAALNLLCFALTETGRLPRAAVSLLDRSCLPYLMWFLAGLCLYRLRDRLLVVLVKYLPAIAIVYVGYQALCLGLQMDGIGYYSDIVTSLLLPVLVITTAYALGRHRIRNDLSYGIFLYHWPVINVIFALGLYERMDHVLLLAGYVAAFLGLGCASWFFLERRILNRKQVV